MAILRTDDGRTLSTYEEINEIIHPGEIGAFQLPGTIAELLAGLELPLTAQGAARVLETFDPELDEALRAEGFVHRRVGCLTRGTPENPGDKSVVSFHTQPGPCGDMPAAALAEYGTPHRLGADDRHHVYAGVIAKGVVLENGAQALVYVTAGEWIRLRKTVLNWPIFPYDGPNLAVSYFDLEPQTESGDYNMDLDTSIEKTIAD